jgi:phosphatidylglycerophosphatase A
MALRRRSPPLPAGFWHHPVHLLALGLGSGMLPLAPGTWGTLFAIPVFLLLAQLPMAWLFATVALLFAAGVWLCGRTASDLGVHDHSAIVWDEVVGYCITMAPFAVGAGTAELVAGFVLFRLFDVVKPWPIRAADRRVHGGFGIMLDDALAAGYAMLCLWGGQWLLERAYQ